MIGKLEHQNIHTHLLALDGGEATSGASQTRPQPDVIHARSLIFKSASDYCLLSGTVLETSPLMLKKITATDYVT